MTKRTLGFTLFMLVCLHLPLAVTAEIINIPEPVPPTFAVREAKDGHISIGTDRTRL